MVEKRMRIPRWAVNGAGKYPCFAEPPHRNRFMKRLIAEPINGIHRWWSESESDDDDELMSWDPQSLNSPSSSLGHINLSPLMSPQIPLAQSTPRTSPNSTGWINTSQRASHGLHNNIQSHRAPHLLHNIHHVDGRVEPTTGQSSLVIPAVLQSLDHIPSTASNVQAFSTQAQTGSQPIDSTQQGNTTATNVEEPEDLFSQIV